MYDLLKELALPFLLAFSISYYFTSMLFKKAERVAVIISIAIGMFFSYYIYVNSLSGKLAGLFGDYANYAIIFLMVVVGLKFTGLDYLLYSPFAPLMALLTGKKIEEVKKDQRWLIVLIVLGIGLFIFLRNYKINLPRIDQSVIIGGIILLAFIYLMSLAMGGKKNEGVPGSGAGKVDKEEDKGSG